MPPYPPSSLLLGTRIFRPSPPPPEAVAESLRLARTTAQRLREHRAFKLASYLRRFTWCILQACEGSRTDEDAARSMTCAFSEDGVEDSYEGFMELAWGRYRDLWQCCRDDY